jgi:hypothetical protein
MSSGGEYKLPYTAEGAFGKITDKQNGGKVARFLTYSEKQTIPVTFTTDENPMYAGKYTDPVVFHIAVADTTAESHTDTNKPANPDNLNVEPAVVHVISNNVVPVISNNDKILITTK